MPKAYMDFVGNAVAGSEIVASLLDVLPISSATAEAFHVWLIMAAFTSVPAICIGLITLGIYAWTGKARLIIHSSLAPPLFMAAVGLYYKSKLAKSYPLVAHSFWNNAELNIQGQLFSVAIFIVIFALLKQLVRPENQGNLHNQ